VPVELEGDGRTAFLETGRLKNNRKWFPLEQQDEGKGKVFFVGS
jgi:hypothetical protein